MFMYVYVSKSIVASMCGAKNMNTVNIYYIHNLIKNVADSFAPSSVRITV